MPHNSKPSAPQKPKLVQPGFEEAQAGFTDNSPARNRFNESVALLRAFNLIDEEAARHEVLELARRLAGLPKD